jgi:dTDP-4-amino-4,6-dideoxygalactose transaminase
MDVPLVDLSAQHREIAAEVRAGFERVFEHSSYILGEEVGDFERAYAAFAGRAHCVGVSSGTDALELALRGLGIGIGDEVILPANTFVATALAVVRAGATPVLADVDHEHLLLDVEHASTRVGPRTRALIPVHLYGQMAPMAQVRALADARGLVVLEDAAQAHGATQDGATPGEGTAAAATSFYPGKNLGAYGDAGAVLTDDAALARRLLALRNWGSDVKYHHPDVGFNARLDTLQAVVLLAKLARLNAWNEQRRAAAATYAGLLGDLDEVRLPSVAPGNEHVWHLYVIRLRDRDRVLAHLHADGIGASIHYPVPVHGHEPFRPIAGEGFPVAERAANEILSLPLFPGITPEQQEHVAGSLRKAVG